MSLAALPWEMLCDPALSDDAGFLVRQRPLARLIAGNTNLPPLAPPLRVLLLISSPPGLNAYHLVDVESQRAAVESATRAFREAGLLHLQIEDIVTPRRVRPALLPFNPHIVHYIGHGSFGRGGGRILLWEDDQGHPFPFLTTASLNCCVHAGCVRSCCMPVKRPAVICELTCVESAGALLDAGIPAVVAQQANFTYESSQRGSEIFYTALTSGLGMAEAVFELRQALAQADRPDWAVPTLQTTEGGLMPLLDAAYASGPVDPLATRRGAAADLPAPSGVFVGRQRELRVLRIMLESAPGTGPALALITGPGGVGKSTLTAQAVKRYGGTTKQHSRSAARSTRAWNSSCNAWASS